MPDQYFTIDCLSYYHLLFIKKLNIILWYCEMLIKNPDIDL